MAPTSGSGGAAPRRFFWWRQDRKLGMTPAVLWLATAGQRLGLRMAVRLPIAA